MNMCKFSISKLFRPTRNSRALSRKDALWGRMPAASEPKHVVYEISLKQSGSAGALSGVAAVFDLGDGFGFKAWCLDRDGCEYELHGAVRTTVSFVVLAPSNRVIHRQYFTPEFVPVDGTTRTFALALSSVPTVLHGPNPAPSDPVALLTFSNRRAAETEIQIQAH